MKINRIKNERPADPADIVTIKKCGNILEIRHMRCTPVISIQKIDSCTYLDLRTGEVKQISSKVNRAQNKASVAQSLRNLRDLINANLANSENALWVTLTYAANMNDPIRLYEDFRRFWQRFQYYLKKHNHPSAEYIIAAEPQGRGAWHLHCLFFFRGRAPFLPNAEIARIWRHGFTKTHSLKNIDNPGLYLTAYLGDMELGEAMTAGHMKGTLKEAIAHDGQKKAIVKGSRLWMYPAGFHLYRYSRGIQKPEIFRTTEEEAQKLIGDTPLAFERTIEIVDEAGTVRNIINYRQYHLHSLCSSETVIKEDF